MYITSFGHCHPLVSPAPRYQRKDVVLALTNSEMILTMFRLLLAATPAPFIVSAKTSQYKIRGDLPEAVFCLAGQRGRKRDVLTIVLVVVKIS